MDSRMYNAAMKGHMEDGDFSLEEQLKRDEKTGYQVTPNGNTIVHVATLFGHQGFVGEVLKITPGLLYYKNTKNETALHIAANIGQSEVVRELLSIRGEETVLVRMTDDTGDTALHKAVRSGHLDIVKILVELFVDPELDFPANKVGETPLYLAAESGFHDALIEILKVYKEPTYVAGPFKGTPLHAAVIQEHKECTRSLWQWNNHLCEEADEWGCNSLHYAVKQGLKDLVSDMLEWKKSLAYIPAGSENDWTTTFHIAASKGDKLMIHELLKHCPDCWDMVDSNGQNALHVAILNHLHMLVNVLLELTSKSLLDEADNEGNTPLHLLAAYWNHLPKSILEHPRGKKMAFNKQNQTPLDIAHSRTWTKTYSPIRKENLVDNLRSSNGRLGRRDLKINQKMETMRRIEQIRRKEEEQEEEKAKRAKIQVEKILEASQIQLVVATLVMTVTFAAGFTLPGGLESDDGPNKGMAILSKRAAFRAFVILDVLAFACSAGAVYLFHLMAHCDLHFDDKERLVRGLLRSYGAACLLLLLAIAAVVAAFLSGIFATLENSLPLAVIVCATGCSMFVMVYFSTKRASFGGSIFSIVCTC